MNLIDLKMLPLSQTEFIKLKNVLGKYQIEIKIAKTKEFKAFLEKMYKQNIYTNQFNLQFHGQLYILKTKKITDCLLNNYYKFNKNEETYNLENKNKKFIVLSLFPLPDANRFESNGDQAKALNNIIKILY